MPFIASLNAELIKTISLRGTWIGLLCALIPIGTYALMMSQVNHIAATEPFTTADLVNFLYQHVGIAGTAAVVVGSVIGGMEFSRTDDTREGANGWTATLLATPKRRHVFWAKVVIVAAASLTVFTIAFLGMAMYSNLVEAGGLLPHLLAEPGRILGAVAWVLTLGLLSFGLVNVVGSVPVPMGALIVYTTFITPSVLLSKTGYWVRFFPELAYGGLAFPANMLENDLYTQATRVSLANDVWLNCVVLAVWASAPLMAAWWRIHCTEVAS